MRDEMDDRLWVQHGHQFSEDLKRLVAGVKIIFCRIAEANFAAPWRPRVKDC
jgi:hypothetical protein